MNSRGNLMKYREAVKIIRSKMGITQQEFADLLNVSVKSVFRWETGKSNPTTFIQRKLIPYLDEYGINVSIEEAKML